MASEEVLSKNDSFPFSAEEATMYRSIVGDLQSCCILRPELAFGIN